MALQNGFLRFVTFSPDDTLISNEFPAIPANQWTYLTASFDGKIKRLYVNGIQVKLSNTNLGGLIYDDVSVTIGVNQTKTGLTDFFNGQIAEVTIYDRALSEDEIISNFNAGR